MAAPKTWLELRSGARGLGGPFLQEHLSALQCVDRYMHCRPSLIIAIGHHQKSRFLEDILHIHSYDVSDAIRIRPLPAADACILLDCQLHRQTRFQRVKGGPQPANLVLHELRNQPENAEEIAYALYHQVFSPFAALALVFVSDFGGIGNVIKLLCSWAKDSSRRLSTSVPIAVVLINDQGPNVYTVKDVYFRLATALLNDLNTLDPTQTYTISQAHEIVRRYLQVQILPHYASFSRLRRSFFDIVGQASSSKRKQRLDFSGKHLKFLLRSALVHFAVRPTAPFNIPLGARANNPIPAHLQHHLADFLRCASLVGVTKASSMAELIAAALLLDAYPPGMHAFFPTTIFAEYYSAKVALVENMLRISGLQRMAKLSFIRRANRLLSEETDCAAGHISFLKTASLKAVKCSQTCIFCMIRPPTHTLECKHRLCGSCVVICGQETDPWSFQVFRCPLCLAFNEVVFFIRPLTAGLRVLSLTGLRPAETWDFLKSLRGHIHLITMAFRDYFDVVVASDSGIFFALTLFSDWTLSDCKHHLPKLRPPRSSKTGQIAFSKDLRWDLKVARYANGIGYVIRGGDGSIFSNFMVDRKLAGQLDSKSLTFRDTDIHISYTGGTWDNERLSVIGGRLIASLFYVELDAIPSFYSPLQTCYLRICCRVPPGPALLDLLVRLRRNDAHLAYRGDGPRVTTPLCDSALLDRCKDAEPFSLQVEIQVSSIHSVIEMEIRGFQGGSQSISHCPYRLEELIRDQGLSSAFGRSDHSKRISRSELGLGDRSEVDLVLEKLQRTIHRAIR